MNQSHALHQLCIVTQLIPDLHRILHMINVEHHETIQMTFRQATVPKRSPFDLRSSLLTLGRAYASMTLLSLNRSLTRCSLIKLIAAIDKSRRIILNLLSIG